MTSGTGWQTGRCVGETGSIPRLGFRSLCLQDSPLGVRSTDFNSVFPSGGTVAASFDRNLWFHRGHAMGVEFREKGVDFQLGPVVGPLGKSPEGGRNWEGFSSDPYLTGIASSQTIYGIQSAGVVATVKHFILNEQEHFRQVGESNQYGYNISEALSSNIDDATLHELYLWPFADSIRAGVGSIMCSYNQLNNSYACQNSYLMNYILKNELSFQGFVMSDWQAQHAGVSAALAGLDMAMPGDVLFDTGTAYYATNLTIAILNGTLPMWRLNDMATRIMAAYYYVNRDEHQKPISFSSWTTDTYGYEHYISKQGFGLINKHKDVRGSHGRKIREMAARSTVLLKNEAKSLPLSTEEKLTAVFGSDSGDNPLGPNGCDNRGCDNGTLGAAWGSGTANYPYLITPLNAIQNYVTQNGGGLVQGITDDYAYEQIKSLARQASCAIVFVNADAGEGFLDIDGNKGDRNNLTLWHDGETLIDSVSSENNNTIVVIHSPGPVMVNSFYKKKNVTAILWAGLPGQESGNSIVDILYGRINPGAKLPFTIGLRRKDYGTDVLYEPNNGLNAPQDVYEEGTFIDYRGFDKYNVTPAYEFGYGLSYTNFTYSDLEISVHELDPYRSWKGHSQAAPIQGRPPGPIEEYLFPQNFSRVQLMMYPWLNSTDLRNASGDPDYGIEPAQWLPHKARDGSMFQHHPAGGEPGGNPQLWDVAYTVRAKITNVGELDGDEVPQLYVSHGGPNDAPRVLRGFDRLTIKQGQSAQFIANLTRRDLSNWHTPTQNWIISRYPKKIFIGSSSRNIQLEQELDTRKFI